MKVLFLNCANRKRANDIEQYLINNDIDVAILADAKSISKMRLVEYPYVFESETRFGLFILSKIDFSIKSIDYTIDDIRININPDRHRDRILSIEFSSGYKILAVYVDYGWYNTFAMRCIEDYILKNKVDIIVGDFNSGYIDDNIDLNTGGTVFQNGFLFFKRYEELGFFDPYKGSNTFTHINKVKKRRFRLDHCFIKDKNITVNHVDEFLDKGISDHKGLYINIP